MAGSAALWPGLPAASSCCPRCRACPSSAAMRACAEIQRLAQENEELRRLVQPYPGEPELKLVPRNRGSSLSFRPRLLAEVAGPGPRRRTIKFKDVERGACWAGTPGGRESPQASVQPCIVGVPCVPAVSCQVLTGAAEEGGAAGAGPFQGCSRGRPKGGSHLLPLQPPTYGGH